MDLDIIQSTKDGEITQFLCDVRDYFKASLATSEYENTSNMFYLNASELTEQLLDRCECLLSRLKNINSKLPGQRNNGQIDHEDVSYLDMSAAKYNNEKRPKSMEFLDSAGAGDKTFMCSTLVVRQNTSFLHRIHDNITRTTRTDGEVVDIDNSKNCFRICEDDSQIYDVCQVATQGSDGEGDEVGLVETQKAAIEDCHFSLPNIDCPYIDLPAGHLSIKKSIKYGQLLKIEKRLFFDQSKKCYCGILNDWLLCYADGPTSSKPTISLYLKIPGIEIEHFGEGKRREISFQITTCDPSKRFVFQAVNEIDAKEWIHAIEAAIRIDISDTDIRNSSARKLPTPPVIRKITFSLPIQEGAKPISDATSNDCIYEEPSSIHQSPIKSNSEKRPQLPHKLNNPLKLAHKFEYDIPKCPPQPFGENSKFEDSENVELLLKSDGKSEIDSSQNTHTITLSDTPYLTSTMPSVPNLDLKMEENLNFQTKIKDVHSKLTSQFSGGPNIKKSFKKALSSTSQNSAETCKQPPPPLPSSLSPETLELKKQKKASNPSISPQKLSNEKSSAKNWFLNRLNKTATSIRTNSSSPSNSPSKCKQSEKENLLNSSSDTCDGHDTVSNSASPILKSPPPISSTSKVNMIINQLEASGHLSSMFNMDAVASFSAICDSDFNNYEPIMTVSTPPSNPTKKV